jgi:hypothetical protein
MLLTCALIFLALLNACTLSYAVTRTAPFVARLCAGMATGLAGLAWLAYLATLFFSDIQQAPLMSLGVLLALLLITGLKTDGLQRLGRDISSFRLSFPALLFSAFWIVIFSLLFRNIIDFRSDGLHVAPYGNWFDINQHLASISAFVYGNNVPPKHPFYADKPFLYPFLSDFLVAFFITTGCSWKLAFFIENMLLALSLVGLLFFLAYTLTQKRAAAYLSPFLFFFQGGLGWIRFLSDVHANHHKWSYFFSHLKRYAHDSTMVFMGKTIRLVLENGIEMIPPQRSLLLGLPIVSTIILLLWKAIQPANTHRKPLFLSAGFLAGMLPFSHGHGFLAIMLAALQLALFFFSWEWVLFFIPATLMAVPQLWFFKASGVGDFLFQFSNFWHLFQHPSSFLFFVCNIGLFCLLLLISIANTEISPPTTFKFYIPFALWFILPSIALISPSPFDALKLFLYWTLISAPFIASTLHHIYTSYAWLGRIASILLFLALTLSGFLDGFVRATSPMERFKLFSQADLHVAEQIRKISPPGARLLHWPIEHSLTSLTGRLSFMSTPWILTTQGVITPNTVEHHLSQLRTIYQGGATSIALLKQLHINYLILGEAEHQHCQVDEGFFKAHFPLVIHQSGYNVFQIQP